LSGSCECGNEHSVIHKISLLSKDLLASQEGLYRFTEMLGLYVADLYEAYSSHLSYCARSAPEPGEITHLRPQQMYCLCSANVTTILDLFSQRGNAAVHSIDLFRSHDYW